MLHILRFEYQPMRSGIHNIIHTTLHTLYIRILCAYTPVLSHNALCVVHYTDYAMDTTALTLLYIQYNTIRTRVCIIAIFLLYSELLYILCADEYTLHSILLILYFTYNTLYTVHCAYSARLITQQIRHCTYRTVAHFAILCYAVRVTQHMRCYKYCTIRTMNTTLYQLFFSRQVTKSTQPIEL